MATTWNLGSMTAPKKKYKMPWEQDTTTAKPAAGGIAGAMNDAMTGAPSGDGGLDMGNLGGGKPAPAISGDGGFDMANLLGDNTQPPPPPSYGSAAGPAAGSAAGEVLEPDAYTKPAATGKDAAWWAELQKLVGDSITPEQFSDFQTTMSGKKSWRVPKDSLEDLQMLVFMRDAGLMNDDDMGTALSGIIQAGYSMPKWSFFQSMFDPTRMSKYGLSFGAGSTAA